MLGFHASILHKKKKKQILFPKYHHQKKSSFKNYLKICEINYYVSFHSIDGASIKHEIQKKLDKNAQFGGQFFQRSKREIAVSPNSRHI